MKGKLEYQAQISFKQHKNCTIDAPQYIFIVETDIASKTTVEKKLRGWAYNCPCGTYSGRGKKVEILKLDASPMDKAIEQELSEKRHRTSAATKMVRGLMQDDKDKRKRRRKRTIAANDTEEVQSDTTESAKPRPKVARGRTADEQETPSDGEQQHGKKIARRSKGDSASANKPKRRNHIRNEDN